MYSSNWISWSKSPATYTREVEPKAVDSSAEALFVTVADVDWSVSETLFTITPGFERYVEVAMVNPFSLVL
jgi:hypothetical protein